MTGISDLPVAKMPQLRAATVSSQVIRRKRKRKTPDETNVGDEPQTETQTDSTAAAQHDPSGEVSSQPGRESREQTGDSDVPTTTTPSTSAPPQPKKTKNAGSKTPTAACQIEWPVYFKELSRTHGALNLVSTFCSTRKHIATTFDTIKNAVETQTKRPLTIEDVAAVKALRPDGITFAYVDEIMLQIEVKGAERDSTFKSGRAADFRSQGPAADASVGGLTGMDGIGSQHPDEMLVEPSRQVLFFEFVDGDLRRQVTNKKTGEATNPNRKLRNEDVKMPVFSQKQLTTLIGKRNQKFRNAIVAFLNRCVDESMDPEMVLKQESSEYIPVPPDSEPSTPKPVQSTIPKTIPTERKDIPEIVQEIKESSWYTGQIVPDGHRVFEAQEPVYGELDFLLSQDMVNALFNAKNITQFYAHQTEAINSLHAGRNVVVATSTSSGKSLIYQLPVLHALEQNHHTRAMYIFPTKALAQDQKRSLREMLSYMPGLEDMLVETFDGDTPFLERNMIREEARIIFTNPDMLHITILPQEDRWRTFLKNLRYVVGE